MDIRAKIRQRFHIKKQTISQIVRELKISRNTVRSILRGHHTAEKYERRTQPQPKLAPYIEALEAMITADQSLLRKRRRNARNLYAALQALGYSGAYDSVQRYVKRQGHAKPRDTYVPLTYRPGEAYQFDWSQEEVILNGIVQKVSVAHVHLCYSRLFFVVAYLREKQEMVFDAHECAFQFFQGRTERGIYDNMKTAIDRIFTGKARDYNPRFQQMLSHYLIEPTACTPAAGWEKGGVEKQVATIRQWIFLPRLSFPQLTALNEYLAARCVQLAQEKKHPEFEDKTIWQVYEEERVHLQPLYPAFDGYIEKMHRVSSTCLVQYDRNRYSVPCEYANQSITVRAYANKIVIVTQGKIVAEHGRVFGRNQNCYDPWHYFPLLARKPGALRNGAPFVHWDLPKPLKTLLNLLIKQKGGDHEAVAILQAILTEGEEAVMVACELALEQQLIHADHVLNLLSRLRPSSEHLTVVVPAHLILQNEPTADCHRYNQLLTQQETFTHDHLSESTAC